MLNLVFKAIESEIPDDTAIIFEQKKQQLREIMVVISLPFDPEKEVKLNEDERTPLVFEHGRLCHMRRNNYWVIDPVINPPKTLEKRAGEYKLYAIVAPRILVGKHRHYVNFDDYLFVVFQKVGGPSEIYRQRIGFFVRKPEK